MTINHGRKRREEKEQADREAVENILNQLMASVAILFIGDDKKKINEMKNWSLAKMDENFSNREKAIKLILSLFPKPELKVLSPEEIKEALKTRYEDCQFIDDLYESNKEEYKVISKATINKNKGENNGNN